MNEVDARQQTCRHDRNAACANPVPEIIARSARSTAAYLDAIAIEQRIYERDVTIHSPARDAWVAGHALFVARILAAGSSLPDEYYAFPSALDRVKDLPKARVHAYLGSLTFVAACRWSFLAVADGQGGCGCVAAGRALYVYRMAASYLRADYARAWWPSAAVEAALRAFEETMDTAEALGTCIFSGEAMDALHPVQLH